MYDRYMYVYIYIYMYMYIHLYIYIYIHILITCMYHFCIVSMYIIWPRWRNPRVPNAGEARLRDPTRNTRGAKQEIEIERQRERDLSLPLSLSLYIYIYVFIEREREILCIYLSVYLSRTPEGLDLADLALGRVEVGRVAALVVVTHKNEDSFAAIVLLVLLIIVRLRLLLLPLV